MIPFDDFTCTCNMVGCHSTACDPRTSYTTTDTLTNNNAVKGMVLVAAVTPVAIDYFDILKASDRKMALRRFIADQREGDGYLQLESPTRTVRLDLLPGSHPGARAPPGRAPSLTGQEDREGT